MFEASDVDRDRRRRFVSMNRFKDVLRARLGNFVPSERRYLMGRDWKKSSEKGFEVRELRDESGDKLL